MIKPNNMVVYKSINPLKISWILSMNRINTVNKSWNIITFIRPTISCEKEISVMSL